MIDKKDYSALLQGSGFTCQLSEFVLNFTPVFGLWDISYKQARFGLANVYFEAFAL
jgi:hypothetical protein